MEARLKIFVVIFGLVALALLTRLFYWQVVRGNDLSRDARLQHKSGQEVSSPRGNILAADGTWLATSNEAWLIFASKPELKSDAKTLANRLAPFFVEDQNDKQSLLSEVSRIETLLGKKDVVWVPLQHKVAPEVKKNIEALRLAGIGFEPEETRAYPEASSSAHLLGFVGKDEEGRDKGYFGLEGYYDLSLSPKAGFVEREKDARGAPILSGSSKEISAVGGVDLVTHIDKTIQLTVEKYLKKGLETYGATAGTVIVLDPRNGAVLAMASSPAYDPLKYYQFGNSFFKNPAISDSFEPGSIFKPLVMAAALDAQAVKPETKCDICTGPVKVDKYQIETWDKKYYPDATMTDVIVHSDNVGMTFVGSKLGADKLFDYLNRFGLGKITGIDLQGEENPGLRKKGTWNEVDLATATFGQGIAVTPIQIIKAFSAIANGGETIKPEVVGQIKKDNWNQEIRPEKGERVISSEAAQEITEMMVAAVKNGEAKWTVPKGFQIAGKTGTAQIPVSGHYDTEKTIASFIGFAPAEKPKFLMLVTLREPQSSPWGSETAAPLWFNIARELFPYLGIQPES